MGRTEPSSPGATARWAAERAAWALALLGAFTATACAAGEPPWILDPGPQSARVGEQWSVRVLATDPDGDDLQFTTEAAPVVSGGLEMRLLPDLASIQLSWTPTEEAVGQQVIKVAVSDGSHTTRSVMFIDVALGTGGTPRWQEPVGTGQALDLNRSACIEIDLLVQDNDSESVEFIQLEGPGSATLSPDQSGYGALWSWCPTPEEIQQGHYNVVWGADDGINEPAEREFLVALRGEGVPDEPEDGPDSDGTGDPPPDDSPPPDDDSGADDLGDCCEVKTEGAGCSGTTVEQCVCEDDDYCCETAWDQVCVGKVDSLGCGQCVSDQAPSACCEESATAGCSADSDVETCVCDSDAFCCSDTWDATCVSNIELLGCGTCG